VVLRRPIADFVVEENRFGYFTHGLPSLPALALQRQVGFVFADLQVALHNSLGALHDFARLQPCRKLHVFAFQACQFDFRANEQADRGN
jgi:hypothetical protein